MSASSSPLSSPFAQVELFRGVDRKELERLERIARVRRFEPGQAIVQQDEHGIAFFIITKGRARATQLTADGQERELRIIGPGGSFGEMALFTDRPRSATVTAVEPTECLALHRLDFLEELRNSPEIAIRLLDTLSQRLIEAERRA